MTEQIHKFRVFDKNIVLDVNSGSVFEVDDLVYDVLDYYDKFDEDYIIKQLEGKYHGPCVYKRLTACGAGREYLTVTPSGDIYPCHQFVGLDEFIMGNVFEKKLNESIVERFKNTHVFAKPECSSCWARFYCSGGCNANNYQINGDLNTPYKLTCKLQKKRIEVAIYLSIVLGEV
ncbi:MAG: uncharacterized protein PWR06_1426 [Thermoanaerobacteraceae bacterium]|nr:uncharacterized protein [Thermoanaerobacteraceae bacterium]